MQFNITFKTIFEYVLKKLVLCIQIRFVSTEKTTRIASRASCSLYDAHSKPLFEQLQILDLKKLIIHGIALMMYMYKHSVHLLPVPVRNLFIKIAVSTGIIRGHVICCILK